MTVPSIHHQATQLRQRRAAHRLLTLLLAALLVIAPLDPVVAADAANQQQAVQIAIQRNGGDGKVLSVDTQTSSDGSVVYAVKVLSNGRVRVFRIPKRG